MTQKQWKVKLSVQEKRDIALSGYWAITNHMTHFRCTPCSAKGTKTLELSFSAFFNYSVLQYTIPLTSKLISF